MAAEVDSISVAPNSSVEELVEALAKQCGNDISKFLTKFKIP